MRSKIQSYNIVKTLIFVLSILLIPLCSYSSHYIGGEITWECQSNGQYIFTLKIYRDCNGTTIASVQDLDVHNHPTLKTMELTLDTVKDISPDCGIVSYQLTCGSGGAYEGNGDGATEEHVFKSDTIILDGIPGSDGWIFSWSGYARNYGVDNLVNPGSVGMTLHTVMYPFNNQDVNKCFDSSPYFAVNASPVQCMGYPFTYNQLAIDKDLDSLSYSWAEPLDEYNSTNGVWSSTNPPTLSFETGFSYTSPLPGTSFNSNNILATLNPSTGEITYLNFTQGSFVMVLKVEAWRCEQKIAEIYRDFQIVMYDCSSNEPPTVNAPFINQITGLYTSFSDTFHIGEQIKFTLTAQDSGLLNLNNKPQSMYSYANGIMFADDFLDTLGCIKPPCARLNNPPFDSSTYSDSIAFSWKTDCSNLYDSMGCYSRYETFNFLFTFDDNYCPVPGRFSRTVSITLEDTLYIDSPPQIQIDSVTSDNIGYISWDSISNQGFKYLTIQYSNDFFSSFSTLDTLFNTSKVDYQISDSLLSDTIYVFIKIVSGCSGDGLSYSDTIGIYPYVPVVNEINNLDLINNKVRIYPNPVTSILNIEMLNQYIYIEYVALYDITGSLVKKIIFPHQTLDRFALDMENVEKGYYQLLLKHSKGEILKSVVK